MNWLTLDAAGKVVIPLITFALGLVVAFITRRLERERTERTEHLKGSLKLANDWYNQLCQLSVDAKLKPDDLETRHGIAFYLQNRLFLPELLLHIEYLRSKGKYQAHVIALEEFIALVATPSSIEPDARMSCLPLSSDLPSGTSQSEFGKLDELLPKLDGSLQAITRLTGKALAA